MCDKYTKDFMDELNDLMFELSRSKYHNKFTSFEEIRKWMMYFPQGKVKK